MWSFSDSEDHFQWVVVTPTQWERLLSQGLSVCLSISVFAVLCVCVCVCLSVCLSVSVYVYMCACMHECVRVDVFICGPYGFTTDTRHDS